MIEVRILINNKKYAWMVWNPGMSYPADKIDITGVEMRIDGVVYKSKTPEFINAYNKELAWMKLQE